MDVTANLTSESALSAALSATVGRVQGNADEFCWVMVKALGLPACPDPSSFGFPCQLNGVNVDCSVPGAVRTPAFMTSKQFLDKLRAYQLSQNAATQAPGGNPNVPIVYVPTNSNTPATAAQSPTGMGVLGPTDCQICQTLASNPLLLVLVAAAGFFLLFK